MTKHCICILLLTICTEAKEVQIGVLGLFHSRDVAISAVPGKSLECGNDQQTRIAGQPWQLHLLRSEMRVTTGVSAETSSSFTCDDGYGGPTEFRVSIPGKIARLYHGRLKVAPKKSELLIVVTMDLETAVASVVAAESPPDASMEALKAQAVAARSFLVAGGKRHHDFDFCDTTHCQFLRQPPVDRSPAALAATATRGLVLAYGDHPFPAMYSASCGGRTHSLEELGLPVRDYPYFPVECPYCRRNPDRWVTHMSRTDAQALASTETSRITLARRLGWKTVPSNSHSEHEDEGSIIVEGTGSGHGIGLCQRGAVDMARHGSSFQEILRHYYPNTVVKQI
jgi:stage II sporulation protein D